MSGTVWTHTAIIMRGSTGSTGLVAIKEERDLKEFLGQTLKQALIALSQ